MNSVEAMKPVPVPVNDRPRAPLVACRGDESGRALVAVHDSGIGLAPDCIERVFETFYTTKANGQCVVAATTRLAYPR